VQKVEPVVVFVEANVRVLVHAHSKEIARNRIFIVRTEQTVDFASERINEENQHLSPKETTLKRRK